MKTNKEEAKLPKDDQEQTKQAVVDEQTEAKEKESGDKKDQKKGKTKKKSRKQSAETDALKEELAEINDKFLRLYSEFDNFRKRTSREKLELAKTASESLILELLPVLDDFERAIKSADETSECDSIRDGMILIYNKLNNILQKKGLAPIEAVGQAFDTDYHEAISFMPSPSEDQKGKVIEQVEKGYMLQDKVIRYTKVVIGQ